MIGLIIGFLVGLVGATVCYRIYFPHVQVGGKLVLAKSNSGDVVYQLTIFDKTGEKMKKLKQVLVDVEVSDEVLKDETDSN